MLFQQRLLTLVMGCLLTISAHADRGIDEKDFSGWLNEYDSLRYVEDRNAFIFTNTELKGKYQKILLAPVQVFSENAEADPENAPKAAEYLTKGISQLLDEKGIRALEPGPGVAHLKIAITGVEKSVEDLKPRNLVPVAAVFRGAQAASGNLPTYISTMFEGEAVDSISGGRIMAIVLQGIAETEKKSGDVLTFEDIRPTLDAWLAQFSYTMDDFLAKKAGN